MSAVSSALGWLKGIPSGIVGTLKQADVGVFKQGETWKAFGIAALMFVTISFAALSMFDSMDEVFASDADPAPIPNIVFESLNRTGIESNVANDTGWISLDDHSGSIIILDFMAHDCSNCHAVQEHIEKEMDDWQAQANASGKTLKIFGYGAWYIETLDYLNETSGAYHVPAYPTGLGSTTAAILEDGSTTDPVRLFTTGGSGQIPVVMVLDEEGYHLWINNEKIINDPNDFTNYAYGNISYRKVSSYVNSVKNNDIKCLDRI